MKQKMNLMSNLRAILDGCYIEGTEPAGPTKDNPEIPHGMVSLSAVDTQAYEDLCMKVKYKPTVPVQEVGGGGILVAIRDLAAAIKAAPQDLAAEAVVVVPE